MATNSKIRLALHSTHEAAAKIGGIGAALDGIIPEAAYQQTFDRTLLAGAFHFPPDANLLTRPKIWRVHFDSAQQLEATGDLKADTRDALKAIAAQYGTRIAFGQRRIGSAAQDVWAYILLASPDGVKRPAIADFRTGVEDELGFNLPFFENFPAIKPGLDLTLERMLCEDPNMSLGTLDAALSDICGDWIPGGIHFVAQRGVFPPIVALDSFQDFLRQNHYLIELQFYLYVAPALWQAARAVMEGEWGLGAEQTTFFAHDWIGVPLYWAMRLDKTVPRFNPRTVYFAHEARIARMLVEGAVRQIRAELATRCNPDGHDVSFYIYLRELLSSSRPFIDLAAAFPGSNGFTDVYYHVLNREAAWFDTILAVGDHVRRETEMLCRSIGRPRPVRLCPNGVPDLNVTEDEVARANAQLKDFGEYHLQYRPDIIFTSVDRAELSRAPWRNVGFFRSFAQSHPDHKGLFIWLVRPRSIPTREQVGRWSAFGWPLSHQARTTGGDLREDEVALWEVIQKFNTEFAGRYHILYVNQFSWDKERLGRLDPRETTFNHLRAGTDVELGLSIYEPFGIAALEPFSSGAVCVLSDACGCAAHLRRLHDEKFISDEGFVVGRFTERDLDPAQVDLLTLAQVERQVYGEMVQELAARLAEPRSARIAAAGRAMTHLSWEAVVKDYFLPALKEEP